MNPLKLLVTAIFFSVYFSANAHAAPQFNTKLSQTSAKPGEGVTLSIRISWAQSEANYSVALPNFELENLTLSGQGESQESFIQGEEPWIRKTYKIELAPIKPGPASIQAFKVSLIDTQSQKAASFDVPQLKIQIKKTGFLSLAWPAIALGVVLILIIFLISRIFFKKSGKTLSQENSEAPDDKIAHAIHAAINDIAIYSSPEKANHLINLCSRFIIQRHHLDRPNLSDSEILKALSAQNISTEELSRLKNLFVRFEEIRFSGTSLPSSEYKQLQNDILNYVEGKKILEPNLRT
ncbi:MAG: hypothetical protein HYZ84_00300 [Candidatus Omnitrophica bacterium]|nr:hypothetical protein [Candidatus Omnitrophota bacterium]